MPPKFLAVIAAIAFSTAFIPGALAAQNSGNNWPSQSCGCSSAGKCYVKLNKDYQFECVPDGSATTACTGVCSLTDNPVDPAGGGIMRPKASVGGGGGVLQKVTNP